jgi:hypothetical protein
MPERTDPIEALERISWHLNYHPRETLSLNQVANATGLAWATVRKYAKAIETIQRLAPQISTKSEGIKVGRRTKTMENLLSDPAPALAVYLFVHARKEGGPSEALEVSEHADTLEKVPEAVEKMESLGWIERDEEAIQLTALGVQIAGPIYSEIQNGERSEDILKVDRDQEEIRAVIDSSGISRSSSKAKSSVPTGVADKKRFAVRNSPRDYEQEYKKSPYA